MAAFLIPRPLAMREIPSRILVFPEPLSPKKIFELLLKEIFVFVKFLKLFNSILFIRAKS